jgi:hypothetical protein
MLTDRHQCVLEFLFLAFHAKGNAYKRERKCRRGDTASSQIVEGFSVKVSEVFDVE